eukprot:m.407470 g.407470  ORF g.407470 m.407470 type:complete len:805 (-) comp20138_c0_seq1:43-2457(-)
MEQRCLQMPRPPWPGQSKQDCVLLPALQPADAARPLAWLLTWCGRKDNPGRWLLEFFTSCSFRLCLLPTLHKSVTVICEAADCAIRSPQPPTRHAPRTSHLTPFPVLALQHTMKELKDKDKRLSAGRWPVQRLAGRAQVTAQTQNCFQREKMATNDAAAAAASTTDPDQALPQPQPLSRSQAQLPPQPQTQEQLLSNDEPAVAAAAAAAPSESDKSVADGISNGAGQNSTGPDRGVSKRRRLSCKDTEGFSDKLKELHSRIKKLDEEEYFALPVDLDEAPGYRQVISRPMDLSTMLQKIETGAYKTLNQFKGDLVTMCRNAMRYNEDDSDIHLCARSILEKGTALLEEFKEKWLAEGQEAEEPSPSDKLDNINPNIEFTRKDQDGNVTLPFFSGAPCHPSLPRLKTKAGAPLPISPSDPCFAEHTWRDLTPVTDLFFGSNHSYGPVRDTSCATIDSSETSLILDPQAHASPLSEPLKPLAFARGALKSVLRMNTSEEELHKEAAVLASIAENDDRMSQLLSSVIKQEDGNAAAKEEEEPKDDTSQANGKSASALESNKTLLSKLLFMQLERLLQGITEPTPSENELADKLCKSLATVAQEAGPRHVVSRQALWAALGIAPRVKAEGGASEGNRTRSSAQRSKKRKATPSTQDEAAPATATRTTGNEAGPATESTPTTAKGQDHLAFQIARQKAIRKLAEFAPDAPIVHCDLCNGNGPAWPFHSPAVAENLCHACGFSMAVHCRPRPGVVLSSVSDVEVARFMDKVPANLQAGKSSRGQASAATKTTTKKAEAAEAADVTPMDTD